MSNYGRQPAVELNLQATVTNYSETGVAVEAGGSNSSQVDAMLER